MITFNGHDMSGTTARRPTNAEIGQPYFDTTLNVLLVYDGQLWRPVGNEMLMATVAAAGTNQATGGNLVEGFNVVTAADGTKGVKLPVAVSGLEVKGYNNSTSALILYPAVSGTINDGSANASISIGPKTQFGFVGTSTTNWAASYSTGTVATLTGSETLTNKTLTTPIITDAVQSVAAAGSVQNDAAAITATSPGIVLATGADATKGVVLPAAVAGKVYHVKNADAANAVLKVWPAGTDTINAIAASTNIAMAAKTSATFVCAVTGAWLTIPLLPS